MKNGLFLKVKKRKDKENVNVPVAQQRVYLTKKES